MCFTRWNFQINFLNFGLISIPSDLKERACEQTKGYEMSIKICLLPQTAIVVIMEDGGVDTTVIESCRHKMGSMADFPSLLASSVFDF